MAKRGTHKTRNQLKREAMKTALLVLACIIGWLICTRLFLTAWATHPAEQPVNGSEYLESIGLEDENE